jgi:signal transduction histidine kinase
LRLIQPQFRNKSIATKRSFQAASDLVEGDEQQLEQAFVNLLLNSMEAMGQKGQLLVSTKTLVAAADQKKPLIEVAITDSGGGIASQNLPHLFEPFFTTKQNGTGLGLLITRKIIREHDGDIRAENNADAGATFRITLPCHGVP